MEELVVVNVCLLGGKDPLQNVLQLPAEIKWQDFELLVCDFNAILNLSIILSVFVFFANWFTLSRTNMNR